MTLFLCPLCMLPEPRDIRVWHCPGCAHHWRADDRECRNCHLFTYRPLLHRWWLLARKERE